MFSSLGWIYGKIADFRNTFYDKGVFESVALGARTISIGNITAGGTGKTPLAAYVSEILAARGETICILTRGYGRNDPKKRVLVSDGKQIFAEPLDAGDEPFELAQKLLGKAIVISDADRIAAAKWAKRKFGVTVFVLDDAFQHRKVKRDLDIVCIDATNPFGGRKMLPAGRLREPLYNLKRADVVVITRANLADNIEDLKFEILNINPDCRVFVVENIIYSLTTLIEFHARMQRMQSAEAASDNTLDRKSNDMNNRRALAFCGIGNPENFFEQLRRKKFEIAATETFRDHHVYTQQEVENVEKKATEHAAEALLTTAKDAIKLKGLVFTIPCFVVEIEMTIDKAADFAAMI